MSIKKWVQYNYRIVYYIRKPYLLEKIKSSIENQEKSLPCTPQHRPRPDVQTSEWAMASFAARLEVHVLFSFHMVLIVTCGSRHGWNIVFVWCFVVSCADFKHHLFPPHFHLAFLKYHCFREIFFFTQSSTPTPDDIFWDICFRWWKVSCQHQLLQFAPTGVTKDTNRVMIDDQFSFP